MFTEDQISNLESHAKVMIEAKKNISANINHLIKEALRKLVTRLALRLVR
jgi:hypothetical protein